MIDIKLKNLIKKAVDDVLEKYFTTDKLGCIGIPNATYGEKEQYQVILNEIKKDEVIEIEIKKK